MSHKSILSVLVLGVSTLALPAASTAVLADGHVQNYAPTGIYFGLSGGVAFEDDFDGTLFGGPAAGQTYDIDLETGFEIGGAIGLRVAPIAGGAVSPRVELELSYSERDVDEINFSGNGPGAELNVDGDLSATTLMFNGFLDFNTGTKIRPYIGAGVGVAFIDYDFQYQTGPLIQANEADDTSLAYQFIAGLEYQASEKLAWTLEGRYQGITDIEVDRFNTTAGGVLTGSVEDDVENFSIRVGMRYSLGHRHAAAPLK